ncbi:MAG: RluA family pseudouridine synthase [Eubacteriales bacterium]
MRKIIINDNEKNQRFDRFVSKYLNKAGNSFIQKMIRKNNIDLNGKKARPDLILKRGDIVEFYLAEETIKKFREEKTYIKTEKLLNIIYEDENITIINKPIGITIQPDDTNKISLIDMLLSYLNYNEKYSSKTFRPAFVNRIDKNTSGIVLAAKNYKALKALNKNMRERNIKKYYKGIIEGNINDNIKLEDYIIRKNKKTLVNKRKGKKIITNINPLKNNQNYTLVEIELITGRTHQIRAHLESIGHPLLGDIKYQGKKTEKSKYYYLHSYKIKFQGFRGELKYLNNKTFQGDLPEDFKNKIDLYFGN